MNVSYRCANYLRWCNGIRIELFSLAPSLFFLPAFWNCKWAVMGCLNPLYLMWLVPVRGLKILPIQSAAEPYAYGLGCGSATCRVIPRAGPICIFTFLWSTVPGFGPQNTQWELPPSTMRYGPTDKVGVFAFLIRRNISQMPHIPALACLVESKNLRTHAKIYPRALEPGSALPRECFSRWVIRHESADKFGSAESKSPEPDTLTNTNNRVMSF